MLTQIFNSINWVDVVLFLLFAKVVFFSVKSGFVAEGFRFLGSFIAVVYVLHQYSFIADWLANRTKLDLGFLSWLVFILLWLCVVLAFFGLHRLVVMLFKIEANHQMVDKYAAGFLGAARGMFVVSLAIFGLLLFNQTWLSKQTVNSLAYKLTAKVAPNTYRLAYEGLLAKLFEGQKFNDNVFAVIDHHGINPKRHH